MKRLSGTRKNGEGTPASGCFLQRSIELEFWFSSCSRVPPCWYHTRFFLNDQPPPSMASKEEEGIKADRRKTPPKSPLAADAKPFVPSSSPLRPAAATAAANDNKGHEAEKEAKSEEAKADEEEEASSADEGREEQQPALQKTFPVFTDQQRSSSSTQVRVRGGGETRREARERAGEGVFLGGQCLFSLPTRP